MFDDFEDATVSSTPEFNLLVTSAVDVALVYSNVLVNGFTLASILPGSDQHDCVTCSCAADVDMDGKHELILGTYGQVCDTNKIYLHFHSIHKVIQS